MRTDTPAAIIKSAQKAAERPWSHNNPHPQFVASQQVRRQFDCGAIDKATAVEQLRPVAKMRDGCWAKPFDPTALVELWQSVLPRDHVNKGGAQ